MSRRFHTFVIAAAVAATSTGAVLACGERVAPPPTAPAGPRLSRDQERQALETFHKNNPRDWVGRDHNRAMDAYFAKLARGDVSSDVCNDLVTFMSEDARSPEHPQGSRADRRAGEQDVLRRLGFCEDRFASKSASGMLVRWQVSTLSEASHTMILRVNDAVHVAVNGADLASRINAMSADIWALPAGEADSVWAGASVAVHSMEYWDVNASAVGTNITNSYASCIQGQPTAATTAAHVCMGLSVNPYVKTPILFRGIGDSPFRFAQSAPACSYYNERELVGEDFKGGLMGGLAGAWVGWLGGPAYPITGPASAAAGFVGGAAVGSGVQMMWQVTQTVWCAKFGGAPRPKYT
jgi:hypothetical protein